MSDEGPAEPPETKPCSTKQEDGASTRQLDEAQSKGKSGRAEDVPAPLHSPDKRKEAWRGGKSKRGRPMSGGRQQQRRDFDDRYQYRHQRQRAPWKPKGDVRIKQRDSYTQPQAGDDPSANAAATGKPVQETSTETSNGKLKTAVKKSACLHDDTGVESTSSQSYSQKQERPASDNELNLREETVIRKEGGQAMAMKRKQQPRKKTEVPPHTHERHHQEQHQQHHQRQHYYQRGWQRHEGLARGEEGTGGTGGSRNNNNNREKRGSGEVRKEARKKKKKNNRCRRKRLSVKVTNTREMLPAMTSNFLQSIARRKETSSWLGRRRRRKRKRRVMEANREVRFWTLWQPCQPSKPNGQSTGAALPSHNTTNNNILTSWKREEEEEGEEGEGEGEGEGARREEEEEGARWWRDPY